MKMEIFCRQKRSWRNNQSRNCRMVFRGN